MPFDMTTTKSVSLGSDSYVQRFIDTGDSKEETAPNIPVAKIGSLTGRTDADTGVATMNSGHGFATSDKLDVFWVGGSRRNMTATVAVNAVTIDGGAGDDLPSTSTALTVMKPVEVPFDVDGDEAVGLAVFSPYAGYVAFFDDAGTPALIVAYQLDAGEGKSWSADSGETNPLAGKIVTLVKFSHGDSANERTMKAAAVFN